VFGFPVKHDGLSSYIFGFTSPPHPNSIKINVKRVIEEHKNKRYYKLVLQAGAMAQVVMCLPSKLKTLSSNPCTIKISKYIHVYIYGLDL
jgi:hypothetical protein